MSEYTVFTCQMTIGRRKDIEVATPKGFESRKGPEVNIAHLSFEGPRPFVKAVLDSLGMALDDIESV